MQEHVHSEEIKCDPEVDKSADWAGSGCMAVFPISGSCLISPPGIASHLLPPRMINTNRKTQDSTYIPASGRALTKFLQRTVLKLSLQAK